MEYGDIFLTTRYGYYMYYNYKYEIIPCRFRIDPVPHTGKYSNFSTHRLRTTQERRWAIAHKEYVRSKRNFNNLPNSWDWDPRNYVKVASWKRTKKKRQWM